MSDSNIHIIYYKELVIPFYIGTVKVHGLKWDGITVWRETSVTRTALQRSYFCVLYSQYCTQSISGGLGSARCSATRYVHARWHFLPQVSTHCDQQRGGCRGEGWGTEHDRALRVVVACPEVRGGPTQQQQ